MNIEHWLSPVVMRPLGWVLLHFVWQGTALAALAAAAMALCRRPTVRYALGVAVLILMVAVPLATFVFYWQSDAAPTFAAAPVATAVQVHAVRALPSPGLSVASHRAATDIFPWLVEAWLAGVIFFSLRCAGGVLLLERMRRRQALAINAPLLEICLSLQRRLRLTRAIRYCECRWLEAPAVIGWFRPIVLLPVTALTGLSEYQLQAVIAHELAHVKRLDAFVNAFQIATETILFYHPAVWWLNQRIRAERENSCDDVAIALCGNAVEYARALTLMEEWRSAPALAMAANRGPLTVRISRLLNLSPSRLGARGLGLTTSLLCLAAALGTGGAILGMARPSAAAQSSTMPASAPTAASPAARPTKPAKNSPSAKPSPASQAAPPSASSEDGEPVASGSYIDAMKAVGLTNLTADQLVAMKIQDVTPDYVRGIQEQGFHPDVDNLIGMKIQGVTPDYIRGLRSAGLSLDEDQLIALKIQGADGAYLRALQEAGIHPDTDQLIAMKIQGVTPGLVSELRVVGLAPDADQVIALKVQGVDPKYVQNLYELKLQPSVDDIVAMKIQGVTPDYVREIRSLGLNPTVDEVVSMRIQQITPQYIKALQAAGFKFDVDELISAKVQGITPEFAEQARKHGFQNLTLEKLIELKRVGVFETPTDI